MKVTATAVTLQVPLLPFLANSSSSSSFSAKWWTTQFHGEIKFRIMDVHMCRNHARENGTEGGKLNKNETRKKEEEE